MIKSSSVQLSWIGLSGEEIQTFGSVPQRKVTGHYKWVNNQYIYLLGSYNCEGSKIIIYFDLQGLESLRE